MPVYLVDKPLGPSSHDVVAAARRALGTRRVGHAGTLDPLASGVLVLLADDATKLSPFLTGSVKRYLAWVAFGAGTPTLDAEGPVEAEADPSGLDAERIAAALPPFLDLREQVPPAFSAVKRGGVRSYDAARRGETVELPPRPAGYREIELLAFASEREALPETFAARPGGRWGPAADGRSFVLPEPLGSHPTALIELAVEAGTYVRAFARDLGATLGVPAHLAGLVRTRSGRFGLETAIPLETLAPDAPAVSLAEAAPYPRYDLDAELAARVRDGQRPPGLEPGRHALVGPDGRLVAIAETAATGRTNLLRVWR